MYCLIPICSLDFFLYFNQNKETYFVFLIYKKQSEKVKNLLKIN